LENSQDQKKNWTTEFRVGHGRPYPFAAPQRRDPELQQPSSFKLQVLFPVHSLFSAMFFSCMDFLITLSTRPQLLVFADYMHNAVRVKLEH
jgi:hypothetical protein